MGPKLTGFKTSKHFCSWLRVAPDPRVSGGQTIYVLRPGLHTFHGQPGDTISLIPLSASVADIETRDLKYPLRKETLYFGPARGVSNVLETADTGQVSFPSGMLLAVHTVGRA